MGHKKPTRASLEALIPYATENEAQCLRALIAHDHFRTAAKAAGKTEGSFNSAIRTVRERAIRRGYAPEYGWNPPAERATPAGVVPPGFEIEKVTDNVDPGGNRLQAWNKLRHERAPAEAPPPNFLLQRVTQATAGGREVMTWKAFEQQKVAQWGAMREAIAEACKPYEGGAGKAHRPTSSRLEDTLSMYYLGDPHIGMLSWGKETGADFDLKIAQDLTDAVVGSLICRATPSKRGGFVLIGDNYHAEDDRQITPGHGHKLDVDTRHKKVWSVGALLWRKQIDRMLLKHELVDIWIVCGNHDPMASFYLREWLCAWYRDEPRVTIHDNTREHQFFLFGKCLFGFTHGHLSTPAQLAMVMAHDAADMWAKAKHRHWVLGHEHKESSWEVGGCTGERLRTIAPRDAYAARMHWRSKQGSVVVTYDPDDGEIARAKVGCR